MITLREFAPAKVNLYLHVLGRRADGYHLLESLVAFASAGDSVEVQPADELTLTIEGPCAHTLSTDNNSVLKAAVALRKHAGITAGAQLKLHKNLPVASGVGGGSADAAATLRLLLRFWNITLAHSDLMALAIALGADVPACLHSTSLYMGGIGEQIEKGPILKGLALVLINPGKPLATAEVFKARSGNFSSPPPRHSAFASTQAYVEFLAQTRNDLQEAAIRHVPEIAQVIEALSRRKDCLLARMSGSGATCFGLFADMQAAQTAAIDLSSAHSEWWINPATME